MKAHIHSFLTALFLGFVCFVVFAFEDRILDFSVQQS